MTPRATYRLQFSSAFRFADAARIADYLADLGVSHVYASPYLRARPGSTHGYDIVDHNALNPELGDQTDFDRMCRAFADRGLGQILDYVPNHMGVGGADNPYWIDVLEWGKESPYAGWFDIDWNSGPPHLQSKILVPFLGEQYGVALQSGHLKLKFDADAGTFSVWAYDAHKLPVSPYDYSAILDQIHPAMERLGDEFSSLVDAFPQTRERSSELKSSLAVAIRDNPEARSALDAAISSFAGSENDLASWSRLDGLIQRQNWRPAHFRVAADDINYRRFFNINDLAGIRMELPALFDHAHKLVVKWLSDGTVDGLRIDHIDGLFDPLQYLERLRKSVPKSFYLVVEKILAPHESLREDWPIDGTTGYEFVNQVTELLIRSDGEESLSATYAEFTGNREPLEHTVRRAKLRVMDNEMASELERLARDSAHVARQNPASADFTHNILRRALRQIVACFPVYRTYVSDNGATDADRRYIDWAIQKAASFEPELDPSVFDFLRALLSGDLVAAPKSGYSHHSVLQVARKFQQYTGPVMAKGFEDTALYRFNRFVALNEVGGTPGRFGSSVAAFHKANAARAKSWPNNLLSTATHDTKRGEDVRARLAVLSELPAEWAQQVKAWSRINRARLKDLEAKAPPSRNDEYLFYQLLVGSWPAELLVPGPLDADGLAAYTQRLEAVMQKSIREAREYSSWSLPNSEYENAVSGFVRDTLNPQISQEFLANVCPFAERVARCGVQNSLVQLVLKLTSPGIPDLYQGSGLWDLKMVDPDNRSPIDYDVRRERMRSVREALQKDPLAAMKQFSTSWHDGSVKLAVLVSLLDLRRQQPELFAKGSYEPVALEDPSEDRVCAFARKLRNTTLVIAARLYPATADAQAALHIAELLGQKWKDVLTGRLFPASTSAPLDLFQYLPVAVLLNAPE